MTRPTPQPDHKVHHPYVKHPKHGGCSICSYSYETHTTRYDEESGQVVKVEDGEVNHGTNTSTV